MARFSGDNGNDQLYGTGNADELLGRGGSDVLRGRGGNDLLAGGPGSDLIDGGSGWDTVSYAGQQRAMHVDLAQNLAFALDGSGRDSDALVSIEHAIGSAAGDELLGNGLANRLEGRAGFDTLFGGLGNDRILAGADTDRVVWSSGDALSGEASDGSDRVDGGESPFDIDSLEVVGDGGQALEVDVTASGSKLLTAVEGAGRDLISAVNMESFVFIGAGGSFEGDHVTLKDGPSGKLSAAISQAYLYGEVADDVISARGTDLAFGITAYGGDGNDHITGGRTVDLLEGDAGDDRLDGAGGADDLRGDDPTSRFGAGDDVLHGGAGNDFLFAGWGNDRSTGGSGQDQFQIGDVFEDTPSRLTIDDFQPGKDLLVFFYGPQAAIEALDTNGSGRLDNPDQAVEVVGTTTTVDFSSALDTQPGTMVVVLEGLKGLAIADNVFGFG